MIWNERDLQRKAEAKKKDLILCDGCRLRERKFEEMYHRGRKHYCSSCWVVDY